MKPSSMGDYDDDEEDEESTPISPGRSDSVSASKSYSNNSMNIPAEHVKQNVSLTWKKRDVNGY